MKTRNMKPEVNIPEWMTQKEEYTPRKDSDRFIEKSMLSVLGVLSKMRNNGSIGAGGAGASVFMAFSLYMIVLSAASQNMFFNGCLFAGLLAWFCFMPEKTLRNTFLTALTASLISAVIMIPAVFMGNPQSMVRIALKVFFSVGLLGGLANSFPWNEITSGLRFFHVPDIFVFTLDITLKYIFTLCEISQNILISLKLRSVGKNPRKDRSMSGVLGVTFLKSREMADEMYDAMMCRGFDGEYKRPKKFRFRKQDVIILILAVAAAFLFVYTNLNNAVLM